MNEQEKCTKCNELTEVVYFDEQGNAYCEDCWIEHEAELKRIEIMQDRFKFRIWSNKENKMHKVHSLHLGTNKAIVTSLHGNASIKLDDKILLQCTGLKDKNGKLIYEGDIVRITRQDWKKEQYSLIYLICWDRTQWQLGLLKWQRPKAQRNRRSDRQIPFKDIVSFDDYTPVKYYAQCEIIGNYYQNPELLTTHPTESEGRMMDKEEIIIDEIKRIDDIIKRASSDWRIPGRR